MAPFGGPRRGESAARTAVGVARPAAFGLGRFTEPDEESTELLPLFRVLPFLLVPAGAGQSAGGVDGLGSLLLFSPLGGRLFLFPDLYAVGGPGHIFGEFLALFLTAPFFLGPAHAGQGTGGGLLG